MTGKNKNKTWRGKAEPDPGRIAKQHFNIPEALKTAIGHFYGGRTDLAEDLCREILGIDPKNANACYLLGVISHQTGQDQAAIDLISRSLDREPKNFEAHNYLGIVLVDAERHLDAEESFRQAIKRNSKFPEAFNNLGNVLRQLGRFDEAVANFRKALALRPDYVEALNGLGCSLRDLGRLEEAFDSIRKAIAGDNNHHEAHYNLGDVLYKLRRYGEAGESFRNAIGIKPDYADAYVKLGHSLQNDGRSLDAVSQFRKAAGIEPDSAAAYYFLATALGSIDRVEESAAEYENALRLCKAPELKAQILLGMSQLPSSAIQSEILTLIDELGTSGPDSGKAEAVEIFHRNLAFARAGALDRKRRYEEAWQSLVEANSKVNAAYAKEWSKDRANIEGALKSARAWTQKTETPDSGTLNFPAPLFILGPSRSGKSTLEKLAGSLEGVKCDYEGLILSQSIRSASQSAGIETPASLAELPVEQGPVFLEHFRRETERTAGGARVLTNTSQVYIRDVGWLAQMVPTARFIFVDRNKEDTALRIFMKLYQEDTNHYAYDLEHIFNYISWYKQLFDVWEGRLSAVILRLNYEDMIADPKQTRGKVAAFCGLEAPTTDVPALGDDRGAAAPYRDFLK